MKLKDDVVFNDQIQPACLPSTKASSSSFFPDVNSNVYIAGWGRTDRENPTSPDFLQNAAVNVWNTSYCDSLDPTSSFPKITSELQVCVGKYCTID
jgi:hypothetical protein